MLNNENEEVLSTSELERCASQEGAGAVEENIFESKESSVDAEKINPDKKSKGGRRKKQYSQPCSFCGISFTNAQSLNLHRGTREELFCSDCPARFCTKKHLNDHMMTHLQVFKCTICGKGFELEVQLNHHLEKHLGKQVQTKRLHTCSFCGMNCKNAPDLLIHESGHEAEKLEFPCSVCGKGFRSISDRSRHELNHIMVWCKNCHEDIPVDEMPKHFGGCECKQLNSDVFLCSSCHIPFSSEETLRNHVRTHYVFPCVTCDQSFTTTQDLELHERSHIGHVLSCPDCSEFFCTQLDLELHRKIHAMDLSFYCANCGKTFSDEPDLENLNENDATPTCGCGTHQKRHSSLPGSFPCFLCSLYFSKKEDMESHTVKVHGSKVCSVCSVFFSSNLDLELHERNHCAEEKYMCCTCLKIFPTETDLKGHKKRHNQEEHVKCAFCWSSFPTKLDLELHNRYYCSEEQEVCSVDQVDQGSASSCDNNREGGSELNNTYFFTSIGERNDHLFNCHLCDYQGTFWNLNIHIKDIHDEEMHIIYSCSTCSRQLPDKSALLCHEIIHDNIKVTCPVCPKWFTCKKTLKKHLITDHEGNTQNVIITCFSCSEQFSDYSALTSHQVTHTYNECPICLQYFKSKEYMTKHLRRVHQMETDRNDCSQ